MAAQPQCEVHPWLARALAVGAEAVSTSASGTPERSRSVAEAPEEPNAAATKGPGVDVGAWFEAHASFVARSVQRLCGLQSSIDDLVQDVFVIAFARREQLAPGVSPRGWLYRTAVHLVWHQRRALARRLAAEARLAVEPGRAVATPDDQLQRRHQALQVRACVAELPLKQREVFVLFELEGWDGRDIADALGLPLNTVWTRLHHARRRFKQHWAHVEESTP